MTTEAEVQRLEEEILEANQGRELKEAKYDLD